MKKQLECCCATNATKTRTYKTKKNVARNRHDDMMNQFFNCVIRINDCHKSIVKRS